VLVSRPGLVAVATVAVAAVPLDATGASEDTTPSEPHWGFRVSACGFGGATLPNGEGKGGVGFAAGLVSYRSRESGSWLDMFGTVASADYLGEDLGWEVGLLAEAYRSPVAVRAGPGILPERDSWFSRAEVALGIPIVAELFARVDYLPEGGAWLAVGGLSLSLCPMAWGVHLGAVPDWCFLR
jgi:hypothetical protein